jgi:NAD(P)-dependent dehydrogenase (short-subunit alcohol dehydrogenase family)
MVEQGRGGRIVNVTSVHEHTPLSDGGAYTVAKHGLGREVAYARANEWKYSASSTGIPQPSNLLG